MLFALLFDERESLVAAAPAADQHAIGDDYWRDVYPQQVTLGPGWQTAYATIRNPDLAEKLLALATDDAHLHACRQALDRILMEPPSAAARPAPRAA